MTRIRAISVGFAGGVLLLTGCGGGATSAPSGTAASSGSRADTSKTTAHAKTTKHVTVAFLKEQIELSGNGPIRLQCPSKPPSGMGNSIRCRATLFVQAADLSAKPKYGTAVITQTDARGTRFRYEVQVGSKRFGDTITFSP